MKSPWLDIWPVTACVSAILLAGVLWWSFGISSEEEERIGETQGRSRIESDYPMPSAPGKLSAIPDGVLEGFVSANPFSPERATVREEESKADTTGQAESDEPLFVFKGLVQLGDRQRAIIADSRSKKTYFLEVGQEVAGFKVLDISETRVILSNLQTHEEIEVARIKKGLSE